ncbi:Retrotransposon gag domain [Sesbania bispinosa]|nr:Retrotransposon gag domain [Sesbania bispinosa]
MPPSMSDRVDSLEAKFAALEDSLNLSMVEFKQSLLQEMSKMLEKRSFVDHGSRVSGGGGGAATGGAGAAFSSGDSMDDYRMTGKKVKLAKLSMGGYTIHWFNLWKETEDPLTWPKLKQALFERYGCRHFDNPFEELSDLRQKGSIEEYIVEFELIPSQVGRSPEEHYLRYFMGGLRLELRCRVRTFNPRTRTQMMRVARDLEAEMIGVVDGGGSFVSRPQGDNHEVGGKIEGDYNITSHNFISPQVVAALELPIAPTHELGVTLVMVIRLLRVYESSLRGSTSLRRLSSLTTLGGIDFTIDAYVLDLGGLDVILGVAWLRTLGKEGINGLGGDDHEFPA